MRSFVVCATNPRRYIKQLLWAGHEVRMYRRWGNMKERDNVFNLGVDWRIILKWIVKK
jgi:hypothetical protein